jgi:hypothetical protein
MFWPEMAEYMPGSSIIAVTQLTMMREVWRT